MEYTRLPVAKATKVLRKLYLGSLKVDGTDKKEERKQAEVQCLGRKNLIRKNAQKK